ncbi:type IV secretion system DNA-binding domain-containing protein [Sporosalibacterium faouarense]|uniref:type IV secretion system DNA-binding domain-containing protein n=1 Tax=Sporosalibacterium faouarense TaxID=516123 RepID=UPI00192C3D4B|nr:type IV secretion system DNA-binding domain-containing protein [Sporosalibacterium faouarense]
MIDLKLMYKKAKLNDTYVTTLLITDFPDRAVPGFIYNLTHGEFAHTKDENKRISVNVATHIRKAQVKFDWQMNAKMNRLDRNINASNTGKISDKPREEEVKALNSILHFRDGSGSDKYVELFLLVTISSDDKRLFRRRLRSLKNMLKDSMKMKYKELAMEQHLALSAAWAGGNKKLLDKYHGRIMDMDTLAAFYPFLDGSISHKKGCYIGHRTKDGTAVYKSFTDTPDDQNFIVTGRTGWGKSTELKALVESMENQGMKGYIYDVDGEYYELCQELGGLWIDLTQGSGKFIDPTYIENSIFNEIDPTNLSETDYKKAKEADDARYSEASHNTLGVIGLLVDKFTAKKRNAAAYALLKMWENAGIKEEEPSTWSTREGLGIHKWYEILKEHANSDDEDILHKEGARLLHEDLWNYFEGVDKNLFKNAISPDYIKNTELVVFHVASTIENALDQQIGAAKMVMASHMAWEQIKRDRLKKQKFSFSIYEEVQRLIKNDYAAMSIYRDTTTGRKFNLQCMIGFNDPSILFPDNKGLWDNTKYKILFTLEKNTIEELADNGAMPREVIDEWLQLEKYQFILAEKTEKGNAYDILRAELPDSELKLSKTRGLN